MKSVMRTAAALIAVVLAAACPALGARLTIGPVLENPGADTMTVMWETDGPADCSIVVGDTSGTQTRVSSLEKGVHHLVTLSGLKPGTAYAYRVMEGGAVLHEASFTTLGAGGSYVVAFIGDTRNNPEIFRKLLLLAEKSHPRFIVNLGDMVSNGEDQPQWRKYLFDVSRDTFDHIPLVAVLGNHDLDYRKRTDSFQRYFPTPKSSPAREPYYAFMNGSDLFIVLDVYTDRPFFPFTEGIWLWKTLKQVRSNPRIRHTFVLSHEGVLSFKGRRNGFFGLKLFTGVMGKYGVTALISSHDHHYIRGETYSGVPFFITGGGGAPLYDVNRYNPGAALVGRMAFGEKTYNILLMRVQGDVVTFTALDEDGRVIDETQIKK